MSASTVTKVPVAKTRFSREARSWKLYAVCVGRGEKDEPHQVSPDVQHLYGDIVDLAAGPSYDYVTGKVNEPRPPLEDFTIFMAPFPFDPSCQRRGAGMDFRCLPDSFSFPVRTHLHPVPQGAVFRSNHDFFCLDRKQEMHGFRVCGT